MIEFRGPALRLNDLDLPRVGRMIGVGEDEIHAILDVEAAGSGFDAKGRPKMLFEPHLFHRFLSGAKRERAIQEGLAYDGWRPGTYPPDSYPRLIAAMKIDETAALRAASWGLGQILGDNYKVCGYDSPQAMVIDFTSGEDAQLEAMIRFIKAKGLDDDLRNHEWASFARGYNGALYAAHGYHLKLRAAFEKWQKIKDTPFDPSKFPDAPRPKPKQPKDGKGTAAAAGLISIIWASITGVLQQPAFVIGGGVFLIVLGFIVFHIVRTNK